MLENYTCYEFCIFSLITMICVVAHDGGALLIKFFVQQNLYLVKGFLGKNLAPVTAVHGKEYLIMLFLANSRDVVIH